MNTLTVEIQKHAYDVHIGHNAYDLLHTNYDELLSSSDKIAVIADETAAALHLQLLLNALQKTGKNVAVHKVPAGEACKTPEVYVKCQSFLLQNGCTRDSLLIAFGGGACGDLTGFTAATFMRGIRFLQCPTTILAHDSAVGGKTAINMPEGKNMIGSFHQPSGVLFEADVFTTLPPREIRSGMAELLKHAYISDEKWTNELLNNPQFTRPSAQWLSEELMKGVAVKAKIVAEDEFERSVRKFLNLGHTFGHAVEAVCGFGELSHGECVMIGMAYSMVLSEQFGNIAIEDTDRFIQFALHQGYTFEPLFTTEFNDFLRYMEKDKKVTFGKLNFVLLQEIGKPFVVQVEAAQCEKAFHELRLRTKGG